MQATSHALEHLLCAIGDPIRLGDAGGSRVQLEVFKSIEDEAASRQGALPNELIAA